MHSTSQLVKMESPKPVTHNLDIRQRARCRVKQVRALGRAEVRRVVHVAALDDQSLQVGADDARGAQNLGFGRAAEVLESSEAQRPGPMLSEASSYAHEWIAVFVEFFEFVFVEIGVEFQFFGRAWLDVAAYLHCFESVGKSCSECLLEELSV